jgi:hypothetical protein
VDEPGTGSRGHASRVRTPTVTCVESMCAQPPARCALSVDPNGLTTWLVPRGCLQPVSRRRETPGLLIDSRTRSAWSDTVWMAVATVDEELEGEPGRGVVRFSP